MGPPLDTTRLAAQMGGEEIFGYFYIKVARTRYQLTGNLRPRQYAEVLCYFLFLNQQ